HLVVVVGGPAPVDASAALVAAHADGVLLLDGRAPLAREAGEVFADLLVAALGVQRSRAVARLADAGLVLVARVLPEGAGVLRVAEVLGLHVVALDAGLLADVGRLGGRGARHACTEADGQQPHREPAHAPPLLTRPYFPAIPCPGQCDPSHTVR